MAAKNLAYRAPGGLTARKRRCLKGMVRCNERYRTEHPAQVRPLARKPLHLPGARYEAGPETANPSQGGILSHRLHAFDGAGRSYVALGKLELTSNGVRSFGSL